MLLSGFQDTEHDTQENMVLRNCAPAAGIIQLKTFDSTHSLRINETPNKQSPVLQESGRGSILQFQ